MKHQLLPFVIIVAVTSVTFKVVLSSVRNRQYPRVDNRNRYSETDIFDRYGVRARARCSKNIVIENGERRFRERASVVYYQCHQSLGYTLYGAPYALCLRDQWSESIPVCVKSGCSNINNPTNSMVRHSFGGGVVFFFCNNGYRLEGDTTLYCNGTTWNGTEPTCKDISPSTVPSTTINLEAWDNFIGPTNASTLSISNSTQIVTQSSVEVILNGTVTTVDSVNQTTANFSSEISNPSTKNATTEATLSMHTNSTLPVAYEAVNTTTTVRGETTATPLLTLKTTPIDNILRTPSITKTNSSVPPTEHSTPIPTTTTTVSTTTTTTAATKSTITTTTRTTLPIISTAPIITTTPPTVSASTTQKITATTTSTTTTPVPTQAQIATTTTIQTTKRPVTTVPTRSTTTTTTSTTARPTVRTTTTARPIVRTTTTARPVVRTTARPVVRTTTVRPTIRTTPTASSTTTTQRTTTHYPWVWTTRKRVSTTRVYVTSPKTTTSQKPTSTASTYEYKNYGGDPSVLNPQKLDIKGNADDHGSIAHVLEIIGIMAAVVLSSIVFSAIACHCWRKNRGIARARSFDLDGHTLSAHDANDDFMWMDQRFGGL